MMGSVKTAPPRRERKIGGTTYIVTSYFKEQGVTAADRVRHLIDTATKEQKIRKNRIKFDVFSGFWYNNGVIKDKRGDCRNGGQNV